MSPALPAGLVVLVVVVVAVAFAAGRASTWRLFASVPGGIEELQRVAYDVRESVARSSAGMVSMVSSVHALIPHFVSVLVEGKNDKGEPVTVGKSRVIRSNDDAAIEISPYVPIFEGRVTVFADLSRIAVEGIFVGLDRVDVGPGDCAMGIFREIVPGVRLTVQCRVRGAS